MQVLIREYGFVPLSIDRAIAQVVLLLHLDMARQLVTVFGVSPHASFVDYAREDGLVLLGFFLLKLQHPHEHFSFL